MACEASTAEDAAPSICHAAETARPALPPPAPSIESLGPEALFESHIRKMPPAKKLYLAMLIMDDLNTLCGKRKAKRNQQYVVQALTYANELAALPQPMLAEEVVDQPLLSECSGE